MKLTTLALGLVAIAAPAIDASANDMQLSGRSTDPRVTRCGVTVQMDDRYATIAPFIETTIQLAGDYRLEVTKSSKGGSSRSVQASAFSGSDLGSTTITVDWPADISVLLSVTSESGAPLCDASVKLGQPTI